MKISSRSLLSPGRAAPRDQQPISLTTSLSRRLKNSRSIKGGASPAMFTATGKKRGAFENPEPSSPKVTCIGQVRVKTKKKHSKNGRSLSRRRTTAGEVNFRKLEHSLSQTQYQLQNQECLQRNNERWVHLPLTIYESLRTFGSEFSCLFPCRSSCSSTAMEKEEKRQGSCGAVFVRWLVALQEGDGGGRDVSDGRRESELVAGDENEEADVRNSRRHVFQDLEIVNDVIMGSKDEGRVSICVPPKNALLLMRCRSDPVKMEALTNRFWEPNLQKNEEFVDDEDDQIPQNEEKLMAFVEANDQEHNALQMDAFDQEKVKNNFKMETKQSIETIEEEKEEEESMFLYSLFEQSTYQDQDQEEEESHSEMVDVQEHDDLQKEAFDQEKVENNFEMETKQSIETNEEEEESMFLYSLFEDQDQEEESHSEMVDVQEESFEDVQEELFEDVKETQTWEEKNEETVTKFTKRSETKKVEFGVVDRKDEEKERLPECLLLMMYEPKLSMEVSKETWVCSTDFIRHRRTKPPPAKSTEGQDGSKVNGNQVKRMLQQPGRSSCSFPVPTSMGTGNEPLVLTRCKSEPMRTPSAKLAPESCFWRNKLEPPRRASFGMDMAGLGLGF